MQKQKNSVACKWITIVNKKSERAMLNLLQIPWITTSSGRETLNLVDKLSKKPTGEFVYIAAVTNKIYSIIRMIETARKKIWIYTDIAMKEEEAIYMDIRVQDAIGDALRRGVDVRIIFRGPSLEEIVYTTRVVKTYCSMAFYLMKTKCGYIESILDIGNGVSFIVADSSCRVEWASDGVSNILFGKMKHSSKNIFSLAASCSELFLTLLLDARPLKIIQ